MMKKIIFTLALLAFAGSAFATSAATVDVSGLGLTGFNPSNNVKVGYVSDSGTANASSYYGIASKHAQGNVIFGSTSGSTSIWKKDGTAGTALSTDNIPAANSTSAVASGWTAM